MATEADPRIVPGAPEGEQRNAFVGRLSRGRLVLIVATAVFAVLVATDTLSPLQGLAALAIIGAAALVNRTSVGGTVAATAARGNIAVAAHDRVIGAVVAGVPDGVIVVDRQMIVVAFNSKAQVISPAIVTGQPVSFALRVPDLIDAIRRTVSTGQGQRVEFFERIPADRWSEAFVEPITVPGDGGAGRELFVVTLHDLGLRLQMRLELDPRKRQQIVD